MRGVGDVRRADYFLKLDPMPCWEELTPTKRRRRVQEMIAEIEEKAAAKRQENGKSVMGMARVQRTSPLERPANFKKSERPLVHAASKAARDSYKVVRATFVEFFKNASRELLQGCKDVEFPAWSFPPGAPFVRSGLTFHAFHDGCVERRLLDSTA